MISAAIAIHIDECLNILSQRVEKHRDCQSGDNHKRHCQLSVILKSFSEKKDGEENKRNFFVERYLYYTFALAISSFSAGNLALRSRRSAL
jgi:hypothetical protein